ncbi:MAG: exonuclease SbcC [Paraglaciecola sp.]
MRGLPKMIFKHLFRAKHLNPDPQVRITAISKLDGDIPEQKSSLHELAFNDADINVSLAALTKLDSFALWYKMAGITKNERIGKKARQMVDHVLFNDDDDRMSAVQKRQFALECNDPNLLERLLPQAWLQADPEVVEHSLNVISKPHLALSTLLLSDNEGLQLALLKFANNESTLQKIVKKVVSSKVRDLAVDELAKLHFSKTQPIEVEKKTRLLLSRLLACLACKDSNDYAQLSASREALLSDYAGLESQFFCLTALKQQEFRGKFADINYKLSILVAEMAPLWQAQQDQLALTQKVVQVTADTQALLVWLADMLSDGVSFITLAQTEQAQTEIQTRCKRILQLKSDLPLGHSAQSSLQYLHEQLLQRQHTYNHLPAFVQAIKDGELLLVNFREMALPEDTAALFQAKECLKALKQQWDALRSNYAASWPDALQSAWEQQCAVWQKALTTLSTQLTQDVSRCRNKIKAVDALITHGKYKAAIGIFAKVAKIFQALPGAQQTQLARAFDKIKSEIDNLQDLQAYIAQPRKPALLAQAVALLEYPLEVDEQANKIKDLRRCWNSLGQLGTTQDDALNADFNDKIEQAFLPCRAHYDDQQQLRAANLTAKSAIIEQLTNLEAFAGSDADLARQLRQMQQQWQGLGEVDYKLRDALNAQYRTAMIAPRSKVAQYYQANVEYKQELILQAEKLLELDDAIDAIEQAKFLQEKWKTAEPAQRKVENQLWSTFRHINDKVFAKRKAHNEQLKQQQEQQTDHVQQQLHEMQIKVDGAQTRAMLDAVTVELKDIYDLLDPMPLKVRNLLQTQLNLIAQNQQNKSRSLDAKDQEQRFIDLFAVLQQWKSATLPETAFDLPGMWQQAFKSSVTDDPLERHELTVMLEVLSELPSPDSDKIKRKAMQLKLMADKLESGVQADKTNLLHRWIAQGPVLSNDLALLQRTEHCFITK